MIADSNGTGRIRPDDELIKRPEVQAIMGGISTSAVYDDADLMRLKVNVTAAGGSPHAVRWILREIHELRAQRVARSAEKSTSVRAQIEARRERRRARQRARSALATGN